MRWSNLIETVDTSKVEVSVDRTRPVWISTLKHLKESRFIAPSYQLATSSTFPFAFIFARWKPQTLDLDIREVARVFDLGDDVTAPLAIGVRGSWDRGSWSEDKNAALARLAEFLLRENEEPLPERVSRSTAPA